MTGQPTPAATQKQGFNEALLRETYFWRVYQVEDFPS